MEGKLINLLKHYASRCSLLGTDGKSKAKTKRLESGFSHVVRWCHLVCSKSNGGARFGRFHMGPIHSAVSSRPRYRILSLRRRGVGHCGYRTHEVHRIIGKTHKPIKHVLGRTG